MATETVLLTGGAIDRAECHAKCDQIRREKIRSAAVGAESMSKSASWSDRSQMQLSPKEPSAQMAIQWPAAVRLAMRDQARSLPPNHILMVAFLLQPAHTGG